MCNKYILGTPPNSIAWFEILLCECIMRRHALAVLREVKYGFFFREVIAFYDELNL